MNLDGAELCGTSSGSSSESGVLAANDGERSANGEGSKCSGSRECEEGDDEELPHP